MKPVMLATDGSPTAEKATDAAIELAHLLGTELVIVSVWDVAYGATHFGAIPVSSELAKLGEAEAAKVTAGAAARAEEAGVETRSLVRRGFPVEAICTAAEKYDPRFLVIGSHGWGAMKRALFGSVSTGFSTGPRARCSSFAASRPAARCLRSRPARKSTRDWSVTIVVSATATVPVHIAVALTRVVRDMRPFLTPPLQMVSVPLT